MKLLTCFLISLALGACATTAVDSSSIEHLRAAPPDGWLAGVQTHTSVLRMAEYLAPDTTDAGWNEKITFERLTANPVPDPSVFIAGMREEFTKSCANSRVYNTYTGTENGYATEVVLLTCPRQAINALGQITMLKVIQGNDALYTITRARRMPPFDTAESAGRLPREEIAMWSVYLSAISVCDPLRPTQHPCD